MRIGGVGEMGGRVGWDNGCAEGVGAIEMNKWWNDGWLWGGGRGGGQVGS